MTFQLTLSTEPINEAALTQARRLSAGMGAAVTFLGFVRGVEDGRAISALEYEAFPQMAEHQFQLILEEAGKKWPIESIRVVHRLGVVPVNEPSLWIEVVTPHRGEAFAACQWIIDRMKELVPIWKKPVVS